MEKLEKLKREIGIHKYVYLDTLYDEVIKNTPSKIIDFGTKTGLTAITMALALKELNNSGHIITYDSWDENVKDCLKGHNFTYNEAKENIERYSVENIIKIKTMDFWDWVTNVENFDMMYIDIDNDGGKLLKLYNSTIQLIQGGAIILFEGVLSKETMFHG